MSNKEILVELNIETLVLVAVWENPSIFQGCIKVTELHKNYEALYFFRCQSSFSEQSDILNNEFSPDDYEFTHLYNESGPIQIDVIDPIIEYALDMMKYALHITLREMISSKKLHFKSIDDVAMQAMINKIRPILNEEFTLPDDDYIGFSVAMDFCPKEDMGCLAALALIKKSDCQMRLH